MREFPDPDERKLRICSACGRAFKEQTPQPDKPKPITPGFQLINGLRFYPACPYP